MSDLERNLRMTKAPRKGNYIWLVLPLGLACMAILLIPALVSMQSAPSGPASSSVSAATSEAAGEHDHDQIPLPGVSWDAGSEKGAKDTAKRALTLFARPRLAQPTWFKQLQPLLSPEYAVEAEYISPAKVPVSRILDGPVLVREAGNPMTVTARFKTNHGPYLVLMHRSGQVDPWVVQSIRPAGS